MTPRYDSGLVAISIAIAIMASYVALRPSDYAQPTVVLLAIRGYDPIRNVTAPANLHTDGVSSMRER